MRLDRAATLAYASAFGRLGWLKPSRAVPVLMYHSVSDDDEGGVAPYYRVSTSPARFREHMRLLADTGCAVISLADALAPGRPDRPGGPSVVLTFDDGFVDFLTHAWPTIEACGFPVSMFLPTAFIGRKRGRFKGRECLTWPEVRDLSRLGVSFGSHTVNHPVLYELPWPEVRSELLDSREQIERETGSLATAFSYPYAFPQQDRGFVSRFRREAHELGYRAGVTTILGRLAPGGDPLLIPRLPVNDADDAHLFSAKLMGAYDWIRTLQAGWRRVRRQERRTDAGSGH